MPGFVCSAPTDETQTMAVAAAPIPDPPALPCSMQAWPNADRKCLEWTAPRAEVQAAEAKTGAKTKADHHRWRAESRRERAVS